MNGLAHQIQLKCISFNIENSDLGKGQIGRSSNRMNHDWVLEAEHHTCTRSLTTLPASILCESDAIIPGPWQFRFRDLTIYFFKAQDTILLFFNGFQVYILKSRKPRITYVEVFACPGLSYDSQSHDRLFWLRHFDYEKLTFYM